MIGCAACGASNPDGAAWCSQCFASLVAEPEPPVSTAPEHEHAESPLGGLPPDGAGEPGGAGEGALSAGVRRGPEGLEWACVACETYNPMEASTCIVCGTSFTARFADDADDAPVDWDAAFRRNLLLPGLGHMAAGRTGSGLGRAVLFCVWLLGWLIITLGGGGRGFTAATPLLAGAAVVYAGSVLDIRRVQHGNPELLAGRTLLWLVVGVTALMVVSTIVAAGVGTSGGVASL